jgi:peptidoglycan/LPS O-acetylase OafA/YrhL
MRTGYFAPASELTPLFHTWSLAIEEQFYILFPVLFVFLLKRSRLVVVTVVGGLFAASLFIAQMGGNFEPSHSPTHTGWSWQSQSSWVF